MFWHVDLKLTSYLLFNQRRSELRGRTTSADRTQHIPGNQLIASLIGSERFVNLMNRWPFRMEGNGAKITMVWDSMSAEDTVFRVKRYKK
jgi:hypothetical protein